MNRFDGSDGCALVAIVASLGLIVGGIAVSYFATSYSLNYWGSQYRGCPMEFGVVPKVALTVITPGYIFPVALVTYIFDEANGGNDVPTAPRARQLGIPVCDS